MLMLFSLNIYKYQNIASINRIKINRKKIAAHFNRVFILLIVKSFETLTKHSTQSFISESFAFN